MYKNRHNVFVSYHDKNDRYYRDKFEVLFDETYDLLISKSVQDGDIPENESPENVQRIIRDEPYRVCRRVNILRDYPDDKIKIYP